MPSLPCSCIDNDHNINQVNLSCAAIESGWKITIAMLPRSRLPIPVGAPPAHPLHRMRSEGALRAKDTQRTLHRLRSLGQLSPPPQEPVPLPSPPPIPPRSPYRPKSTGTLRQTRRVPSSKDIRVPQPSLPDSVSTCSSGYSKDGGEVQTADTKCRIDCDTALPQGSLDPAAVASSQIQSSSHGPDLGDLSQLLLFRGRLQETGCTFSPEGEMLTYGNPTSDADFQQMLLLGPLYDEKWIKYFNRDSAQVGDGLGPDTRILKRMLQNEGIKFNGQHQRTSYVSKLSPKLLRLCEQYDVLLRAEWSAKMQNIHPALRSSFEGDRETGCGLGIRRAFEGKSAAPQNLSWSFVTNDDDFEAEFDRKSRRLTVAAERPHTVHTDSWPIVQDFDSVPTTLLSEPRTSSVSPRPTLTLVIPLRPRGGTIVSQPFVHVPSPLNSPNASSTVLADKGQTSNVSSGPDENRRGRPRRRQDHAGTLEAIVADERKRAEEHTVREVVPGGDDSVTFGDKKKKGMWKRVKDVFGRKKT